MLIALLAFLAATDFRSVLYGKWEGESICTNVRPACHDEHAVYYLAASEKPDTVVVDGRRVVDGKELEMGTIEFHVDSTATTLTSENHGSLWTFTRTGKTMRGTSKQLSDGAVIRNIRLEKR